MSEFEFPTLREAVSAAATVLDEHRPGWHDLVDPETLAVHDPCKCVFGQIGGGVASGYSDGRLWLDSVVPDGVNHFVGGVFNIAAGSDYGGAFWSPQATAHWREEILSRRLAEKLTASEPRERVLA